MKELNNQSNENTLVDNSLAVLTAVCAAHPEHAEEIVSAYTAVLSNPERDIECELPEGPLSEDELLSLAMSIVKAYR